MPPSTIRAGRGHDVEAFGYILADLVERAAAARTGLVLDIDDLLDPFEMGRERTAVALAGALGGSPACLVPGMLGFSQRRLDFFQRKLELIRIELL